MAWFFLIVPIYSMEQENVFFMAFKTREIKKKFLKIQEEIQKNSCLIQNKRIKDKLNKSR